MSRQTPQDAVRDTAPEAPERAATTFYIREVADVVGVSPAVIRSWERQGLLAPARASNGYRLYSYDDVEHARRIRDLLQRDGLNAAGVRSVLGAAEPATAGHAAPSADEDAEAIGKHIRRLRREQGLSLRALAAKTGLGASHISAMERSLTRPSMASVGKLAEGLGSDFLALIGSPQTPGADIVVRKDDRPHPTVDFPGMEIEKLNRYGIDLNAHLMKILPGLGSEGSYEHGGEEFILVLSGEFEVTLDETDTHVLHAMDSISFRSTRPHRWRNPGKEVTVVVWVDTPPHTA
jgi:DNA-binding transcriptional MerR regulator/mannose-6-phosphate isomerase-like protein (cupin superfamily)